MVYCDNVKVFFLIKGILYVNMWSKRVIILCCIVFVEKYFYLKYLSVSLKYIVVNVIVIFLLIWI